MATYCLKCVTELPLASKFCPGCGTARATSPPLPASPTALQTDTTDAPVGPIQAIPLLVRTPKRGGRLAFKGLVLAFVLLIIVINATQNHRLAQDVGGSITFAVGAAYIINYLVKWRKNREVVKGAGIGWTFAVMLLLLSFVALMSAGNKDGATSAKPESSTKSDKASGKSGSSTYSDSEPTKTVPLREQKPILLRDVLLNFKWQTDGFGTVMIADFTLKNSTPYRFKDFEIKCTHFSPSGTVIDSNTNTIYEIVEPMSTRAFKKINMGFIRSQVSGSSCKITDLVPIDFWVAPHDN